jgi:hypothetical protein
MRKLVWFAAGAASAAAAAFYLTVGRRRTSGNVRGRPKSARTRLLETGSALLQRHTPLHGFHAYLCGFHPMKDDPLVQVEAHHYCRQVNEDFAECILFDGNGPEARLTGIEYIISENLFNTLPEDERGFWHPHNFEILSGQLAAPGLPALAEHAFLKLKMNSYGKTWHLWDTTGRRGPADLPYGSAMLAWSFNYDGEADPEMVARRDRRFGIDSWENRRGRRDMVALARPQCGIATLRDQFGHETTPVPGVQDVAETRQLR